MTNSSLPNLFPEPEAERMVRPPEAGPLSQPLPKATSEGGGRRVLVVEDSRDSAASLRMLLEVVGYQVRVAYTGGAGLAEAQAWRPEAIVCDIGLPEMDGYAVARELRADPSTAPIHLVALTGYGRDTDRDRAAEAGFDLHLVKPVGPELLQSLLAGIAEGGSRLAGPGDL
jgi:CheY-like chemotaxis protein